MSFFRVFFQWFGIIIILLFVLAALKVYFNRKRAGSILLKIKTKTNKLSVVFILAACLLSASTIYLVFMPNKEFPVTVKDVDGMIFCITFAYYYFYNTRIGVNGIIYDNTLIQWQEIESWYWLDNVPGTLKLSLLSGGKRKREINAEWKFRPEQKEEIDKILMQYIPGKTSYISH